MHDRCADRNIARLSRASRFTHRKKSSARDQRVVESPSKGRPKTFSDPSSSTGVSFRHSHAFSSRRDRLCRVLGKDCVASVRFTYETARRENNESRCSQTVATNCVKTRVKDHQTKQQTEVARMGRRNRTDAYATRRNHVDACRLWIRLSELFRVVHHPPLARPRLRVYSCKIMPTTPDVLATTPFDAIPRLRSHGRTAMPGETRSSILICCKTTLDIPIFCFY